MKANRRENSLEMCLTRPSWE